MMKSYAKVSKYKSVARFFLTSVIVLFRVQLVPNIATPLAKMLAINIFNKFTNKLHKIHQMIM